MMKAHFPLVLGLGLTAMVSLPGCLVVPVPLGVTTQAAPAPVVTPVVTPVRQPAPRPPTYGGNDDDNDPPPPPPDDDDDPPPPDDDDDDDPWN